MYNLFPQYCLLSEFTPTKNVSEVYNELVEPIQKLKGKAKTRLLKKIAKKLQTIASKMGLQFRGWA